MNEANTEFNKFEVYHIKDINISDKIDIQNRALFDHPLLLGSIQFRTKKLRNKENMEVLDMDRVNQNTEQIINFIQGKSKEINLQKTHKIIQIQQTEERMIIDKYG